MYRRIKCFRCYRYLFHLFVGIQEFQDLLSEAEVSRQHAYAAGTYSNLHTQFRTYFIFCVYFQRKPLPASRDTISGYVQFLSRSLKPKSIRNYLSGLRTLHALMGFSYNFSEEFHLKLLLKGIDRLHPYVTRRARPVTPAILMKFRSLLDWSVSLHRSVWACCLVLFFSMSRLGSVLPRSSKDKDLRTFLTRDRVRLCKEGLLITHLRTKTIQFGKRHLHIPLLRLRSVLCPVEAYLDMWDMVQDSSVTPAFVYMEGGRVRWLTRDIFVRTFRSVLQSGLAGSMRGFTGHSFRRGGASWAFRTGLPGELIQVCGDWSSDAYKSYLEFDMGQKLELAALFCRGLPVIRYPSV